MATTIEGAIVAMLAADTTVSGLIGARIRPFGDPEEIARPFLTYWRVDTDREITNDGPTGKSTPRIQFDAWAEDLLTARQITAAVRKLLNGFRGTVGGINVDQIRSVGERDNSTPADPGKKKPVQRVTLDIKISFTET
jgi:hypothetical protein